MTIILRKNGFYKDEELPVLLPSDLGFLCHWTEMLEIEQGVTLSDLASVLQEMEPELFKTIEYLTNSYITPFLEEIDDSKTINDRQDLAAIEISKIFTIDKTDDAMCETLDCSGRFKEPQVDVNCPGHIDEYCALDLTDWNEIKHLPLKINPMVVINTFDSDYSGCTSAAYNFADISVGDFLYALFDELCFYNDPEKRNGLMKELKEISEKIQNGECKLIPFEDIKQGDGNGNK